MEKAIKMNSDLIVVRDLEKDYGENHAVSGITFSIARGEIFGLLGPNGAGKSTTISMLTGLIAPTRGQIAFDGLDLNSHLGAVKHRIGLVPQELALYPSLSAWDNLIFWGQIYGLRGAALKQRIAEVVDMVQLADRVRDPVNTYSGGMKRRVNLAIGLLHRPEILFLDEPTVGVDPQSRNAIFESVEALNRAGLHDVERFPGRDLAGGVHQLDAPDETAPREHVRERTAEFSSTEDGDVDHACGLL